MNSFKSKSISNVPTTFTFSMNVLYEQLVNITFRVRMLAEDMKEEDLEDLKDVKEETLTSKLIQDLQADL